MLLFALEASRSFGVSLASALGAALSPHEELKFVDGEAQVHPTVDVRGADVYVVQSLHDGPAQALSEKLLRLLFFVATLRDQGAARITAVVPYLAYARKDRRTESYDSVGSRYLAQLLEAAGTDVVMTLEIHNPAAFDNAFRCRAIRLDSAGLFGDAVAALDEGDALVVASPDPGGVKRAGAWRASLELLLGRPVGQAFVDKSRSAGNLVGSPTVVGDVCGATLLIFDDMISSGATMVRAARALKAAGARRVIALAAHGLFVADAAAVLDRAPIDRIFVTDSVDTPPLRELGLRTRVVTAANLFADSIRRQSSAPIVQN